MPDLPKKLRHTPEQLLGQIAAVFPELRWEKHTYIDEGWDHEVLFLDNNYVFRFPNDEQYKKRLKSEIAILQDIWPHVSVDIPDYEYVAPESAFAGYPFIVGDQLTKQRFDMFSAKERTSLAQQLAGFLSTMHNLTDADLDFSLVLPSDLMESHQEVKSLALKKLPEVLNQAEMAVVTEILNDVEPIILQDNKKVLIHSDIYSSNLLWDAQNAQLGVIDFSDMCFGDPAFDFAELHEYGSAFVEQVYSYYSGPKDDDLLRRAWDCQRWVAVFMMTDHFVYRRTSFEVARETFDRVKRQSK